MGTEQTPEDQPAKSRRRRLVAAGVVTAVGAGLAYAFINAKSATAVAVPNVGPKLVDNLLDAGARKSPVAHMVGEHTKRVAFGPGYSQHVEKVIRSYPRGTAVAA